jgi:hypothetical protein
MELIYVLDRGRLQRELRRREAALREAAGVPAAEPNPESPVAEPNPESLVAEPRPESPVAQYASTTRGSWECDLCGRGFHAYGQFLNHNCHEDDWSRPRSRR